MPAPAPASRGKAGLAGAAAGLLFAAALALGGCGGGSASSSSTTGPSSTTTSRPSTTTSEPPHAAPVLPPGSRAAFDRVVAQSGGRLGLAVAPLGSGAVTVLGNMPSGHAWSTMKVPVLVTLLREVGGAGHLSAAQRSEAEAALESSDNAAAEALFADLERMDGGLVGASHSIQDVLRRAGDRDTVVNTKPNPEGFTTFGQTDWSAAAATTFFRALNGGCLLPAADTDYVLSLMRGVVADQRWGLGEAGYPAGASLAFKGGWGPEASEGGTYLVRQSGIVNAHGRGYVASIIALPPPGGDTFTAGRDAVTSAAGWLRERAGDGPRDVGDACG